MRVALVGGTGLLGRHIAAALRARGDEVIVLGRRAGPSSDGLDEVRTWAPGDPAGLAASLRGCHAVVNLAGTPVGPRPWTSRRRQAILESRLAATRTIVDALARLGTPDRPGVLVSASGTDTYTGSDAVPATEATAPTDGFLARVCLAWEAEAARATELGVRVVILRIGFVLAPGGSALRLYALPFRIGLGGPIGDGRQWMSWIHVADVARITLEAMDDDSLEGIVNAVAPEPARQAEIAAAIGEALGRRSWLRVPAALVRLTMRSQAILPLGSRRIVPARLLERGFAFRWPDLGPAMADALG
ncbi:MAG TPA: TIGR01777 family oxidoreductase [Candidatus Limnocylindrales bacterium]|nr:TIGR01777 family oxidoreductase [Candidatus Limnocylindrales bacterium]